MSGTLSRIAARSCIEHMFHISKFIFSLTKWYLYWWGEGTAQPTVHYFTKRKKTSKWKIQMQIEWLETHVVRTTYRLAETTLYSSWTVMNFFKFMAITFSRWRWRRRQFNCITTQLTHSILSFPSLLTPSELSACAISMPDSMNYIHLRTSWNICFSQSNQSRKRSGRLNSFSAYRYGIAACNIIFLPFVFISFFFALLFIRSNEQTDTNTHEKERKRSGKQIEWKIHIRMIFMSLGLVRMRACNQLPIV